MESIVHTPIGYSLIKEGVDDLFIYSWERADGEKSAEAWTWKLGAIDSMWRDVRDRAVKDALPGKITEDKTTMAYANGYLDGKNFIDAQVRLNMARAGYVFNPEIGAVQTIQKLLILLNGLKF